MKYLTVLTPLLLVSPSASLTWNGFQDIFNNLNPIKPINPINPVSPPPPIINPPQNNNTNTQDKAQKYNILSSFFKSYGADLGSLNQPKVEKTQPTSSGVGGDLANNILQGYVNRNAPLINDMMKNPDKQYDVSPIFATPMSGLFELFALGTGTDISAIKKNPPKGKSVSQQVKENGGKVTFYDLVDFFVDFLHNNKPFYNAVLDVAIFFLKKFPWFLDVAFRIIEAINPKFDPTLIQSALNFLYNYEKHSTEKWTKLTDLIIIFLNKDLGVSQRALRNIIALVGNNKV